MAATNTAGWVFGGWQEQATAALRLADLVQHITEVRNVVVEHGHGQGRSQRMDVQYLDGLVKQEQELRLVVAYSGRAAACPTVTRPQF